jgi:hypothetical protein
VTTSSTFTRWLSLDSVSRDVVVDQVLEALPEAFEHVVDREREHAVPRFLHRETGVTFHLVFGDRVLVGMSERRFQRVFEVRNAWRPPSPLTDDLPESLPSWDDVRAFTPTRLVEVPTLLVGEALSALHLHRLGVPEGHLTPFGVRAGGLSAALRGLTRVGWRAPSEVEWEFVVRAAADTLDDRSPPVSAAPRFLADMGARTELCRDSWHQSWEGAPVSSAGWGEGHEVLRGGGGGSSLALWSAPPSWGECVWPSRRMVSAQRPIAIRPVVEVVAAGR